MEEKYLTSANRLAMMYGTELNPKHFGVIIFDEKRITYPIHISKTCLVKLNLTEQKSEIEDLMTEFFIGFICNVFNLKSKKNKQILWSKKFLTVFSKTALTHL